MDVKRTCIRRSTPRGQTSACCVAVLLLSMLTAPEMAGQDTDAVVAGAAVYGDMCGRCHNPRSPLERSDREWVTIINHMRIRGNLTGGQVREVLAFLQAMNGDPGQATKTEGDRGAEDDDAPVRSELTAEGREIVATKACVGCHLIAGRGANVGPKLDGVVRRRGSRYVRRKLADPTLDNATSMMPDFELTDDEIEAVLAYLASLD